MWNKPTLKEASGMMLITLTLQGSSIIVKPKYTHPNCPGKQDLCGKASESEEVLSFEIDAHHVLETRPCPRAMSL